MVIAPTTKKDRRGQPRPAKTPLLPLGTLKLRIAQEHSSDYYYLRNGLCLLGYSDCYQDHGFKTFKALFAHVTGRQSSAITDEDVARRLQPSRTIAPEEAWESDLGPSALRIILKHPKEERAVFFAVGRRVARARSAGQRPEVPNRTALQVFSREVLALSDPAARVALLQQHLQVRPEECVAPIVPRSEQDQPRGAPPPMTLLKAAKGLVSVTGLVARWTAEVRRAVEGHDGPVAPDVQRMLDTVAERLAGEISNNIAASQNLAALSQPSDAPTQAAPPTTKQRPAAEPPPSPAAEPGSPDAAGYAPSALDAIVTGDPPPGWVDADWQGLVVAIYVITSGGEVDRFHGLLVSLASQNKWHRSSHKKLQELLADAQARTGPLPAAVVPLYQRWLAWVGSPNIYASHYAAVAMIASLHHPHRGGVISRLRCCDLPEDLYADIDRVSDGLIEADQDWTD